MTTGRRAGSGGTSLVETLLVCAIFTVIVLITFGLIRYCTKNIGPIEDRTNVQMQLRRLQHNISEELRRTSWKSIVLGSGAGTGAYMHFLCCKSAMSLTNPNFFSVSDAGVPIWTRYVLYYIFRPTDPATGAQACACEAASNPDRRCPHKSLLRVDLDISLNLDENNPASAGAVLQHYLKAIPASTYDLRNTYTAKVFSDSGGNNYYSSRILACTYIAREILSFDLAKTKSDIQSDVKIDVMCYKIKEAAPTIQIGAVEDLTRTPFVIHSEARIIPQNQ